MNFIINRLLIHAILEEFAKNGIEELKNSLEKLFNQLMLSERDECIGAAPYKRTPERRTHSNGFKNKKLLTRTGELNRKIPLLRNCDFYPSCLEKGEKVEQALKVALTEAYVQGVSRRRMKKLTEELCGKEISSTQVSRFAEVLDEEVIKLSHYRYLYIQSASPLFHSLFPFTLASLLGHFLHKNETRDRLYGTLNKLLYTFIC
ncbi:MAG: transposase [Parachlamydiaceae bacterium]